MNKNYFKGIIKCVHCNKNYIRKVDHGTAVFVCSTSNNYGKKHCPCSRRIKENDIVELIERHCEIYNKDFSIDKTKLFIHKITISDDTINIFYRDGKTTIISPTEIVF